MTEDLVLCPQHTEKEEFFESCSSTQIEVIKLRHTWTINNLSLSFNKFEDDLVSPTFSAGVSSDKTEWCLMARTRGKYNENGKFGDEFSCNLKLVRCNMNSIHTILKFGIFNDKGTRIATFDGSKFFSIDKKWPDNSQTISDSVTICHKDLFKPENEILLDDGNDKLDIFCEIIYKVSSGDISKSLNTPQNALAIDFTFLLENKHLSDVTLCASGREFPAHKLILSARSPVFRAMFQCDMEESKNNRVEITDINEEGLGEMLRYMYTGKINELEKMAPRLLGIAEKYDLEDLKMRCAETLLKSLSLENVVEMFILSDTFRLTNLNIQVKKFIKDHLAVIVIRPEFQTMVRTHPHLGIEACCLIGCNEPSS